MGLARARRRGFSLTEILMAVGILGIGMTMVASIYPVAVDQTRRGTDATMAALCARSMAALLRARRTNFVMSASGCRTYFAALLNSSDTNRERPAEFGITDTSTPPADFGITDGSANAMGIKQNMRVYNPNVFLYEAGKRYVVDTPVVNPFWPMWNAGNYVAVVYITPIVPQAKRSNTTNTCTTASPYYNNAQGPWRVTIVVFKSRGHVASGDNTLHAQGDTLHPRARTWYEASVGLGSEPPFAAGGGDFIIDRSPHAGEAYLIDSVDVTLAKKNTAGTDPIYLACGKRADYKDTSSVAAPNVYSGTVKWCVLPGAVMAFHTIIGD